MPSVTVDDLREQLFSLSASNRDHEFILRSNAYLRSVPEDEQIRLLTVKSYLRLGLNTPARELLQESVDFDGASPELTSIHAQIAGLQQDTASWSQLRRRFESNLEVLRSRGIDMGPIRSAWDAVSVRYQALMGSGGTVHVRRQEQGQWRWIPFFADHAALERQRHLPADIKALQPGPYAFDGIGCGEYFTRVYKATLNTFLGYSCPLFVIEPDPALLALVFHLRDMRSVLSDPRVFLFFQPDWNANFTTCFERWVKLPFPAQIFKLTDFREQEPLSITDFVANFGQTLEQKILDSFSEISSLYAGRDQAYWADRFRSAMRGHGEPLRVLSAVSVHTTFLKHSMRDAHEALRSLGHRCELLTETTHFEHISPLAYHRAIREFMPDLLLMLDHLRPEFDYIIPRGLPLLTWDQDQLPQVFTRANIDGISPIDFMAGHAVRKCIEFGAQPAQLLPAIIPTCPRRFAGRQISNESVAHYRCDASFVSHASQTPEDFHDEERSQYSDPNLVHLLDEMYARLTERLKSEVGPHGVVMNEVLAEAMDRTGVHAVSDDLRTRLVTWYMWRLGDRIFRHDALEWAAEWARRTGRSLRIYGNGWEKHPTLSEFAAGPAENGDELIRVYRGSTINLQLMPAGFIHQRALDGLAAGGFFLSRMAHGDLIGPALQKLGRLMRESGQRSIAELRVLDGRVDGWLKEIRGRYYDPEKDPQSSAISLHVFVNSELATPLVDFPRFNEVVFDSAESLAERAEFFLQHDAERLEIAGAMRQVTVDRFSYDGWMAQFLNAHAEYLAGTRA